MPQPTLLLVHEPEAACLERLRAEGFAEKHALAEQTGALAVDMETYAVAQVCRELHRKFLSFRVISDDLSVLSFSSLASLGARAPRIMISITVRMGWRAPTLDTRVTDPIA